MNPPTAAESRVRRLAITVRGVVQGVGFRPFVYNTARARGLSGWVRNEADMVRIEVQGLPEQVDDFCRTLRHGHPPQARIDFLETVDAACEPADGEFRIVASAGQGAPRPTIPADLATCADCLEEIRGLHQRRWQYPFTNCTACGPRWSIIERLPYDRPRTSMARFVMCPECEAEYRNPADRRFHAQPIACPRCGPRLRLLDRAGQELAAGGDSLAQAARAVVGGQVLALKGLGGFQLIVDATSADAVALLRRRKRRPDKPLALMLASLEEIGRYCEIGDEEARHLTSPQAPLLLVRRRRDAPQGPPIADGVAPGNPYLGVMLPYTPLHHLFIDAVGRAIVCTSGNLSEEPMAIATDDALRRLGPIADAFLAHDRPIVRPVDDSVARVGPDGLQILRRARGFAPLPLDLGSEAPTILAVGGHLKNAAALSLGRQAVVGSHVGDLDNVASVEVHRRAVRDLVEFFQVTPAAVACDLHPDYASTQYAEQLAAQWGVPLVRVQHHHAHVAACMAEHRLEGPVLGFSWDGTGYGTDGTVWGGEVLMCEGAGFHRLAHLRTFPLPGGDRAVREPRRSALGLLFELLGEDALRHVGRLFSAAESHTLVAALQRSLHAPRTSSLGRLFDAVAVLCGLPPAITFEGQAAMALEFAADEGEQGTYPLPLQPGTQAVADWGPLVEAVLRDREAGAPVGVISARFHNALADMALAAARLAGSRRAVLTGGCFQNRLLTQRVRDRLLQAGLEVYTHRLFPPGDGGLALGQLWVAARMCGEEG